jgi:hypothetical protein
MTLYLKVWKVKQALASAQKGEPLCSSMLVELEKSTKLINARFKNQNLEVLTENFYGQAIHHLYSSVGVDCVDVMVANKISPDDVLSIKAFGEGI